MKAVPNLNNLTLDGDGGRVALHDASRADERVQCYFKNVKQHLIKHIERADFVFGCVAWLTDSDILAALATKQGVSILVQKEDFLRPDSGNSMGNLRGHYEAVPGIMRHWLGNGGVGSQLSYASEPEVQSIRCVGLSSRSKRKALPRMHHKFAVFCKAQAFDEHSECLVPSAPYEVWTGSFNWSHNASNSFENAIVTQEPKVTKAYYIEFQQLLGLSEPCDWTSEWVEPEWRIGS